MGYKNHAVLHKRLIFSPKSLIYFKFNVFIETFRKLYKAFASVLYQTYNLSQHGRSCFNIRSYYRKENAASPPRAGTMRNLLNKGSLYDPVSPGRDMRRDDFDVRLTQL
jgi:hypothetical protein